MVRSSTPVIGLGMVLSLSGAMVAVSHGDISLLWRGGVGAVRR